MGIRGGGGDMREEVGMQEGWFTVSANTKPTLS